MVNAHDIGCSMCGADPGENCHYSDGSDVGKDISHSARVLDAWTQWHRLYENEDSAFAWTRDVA